jgi:hypothetical protein
VVGGGGSNSCKCVKPGSIPGCVENILMSGMVVNYCEKDVKLILCCFSKQHNINFHVFFDYTAGKPAFYPHGWPSDARIRYRQKAY